MSDRQKYKNYFYPKNRFHIYGEYHLIETRRGKDYLGTHHSNPPPRRTGIPSGHNYLVNHGGRLVGDFKVLSTSIRIHKKHLKRKHKNVLSKQYIYKNVHINTQVNFHSFTFNDYNLSLYRTKSQFDETEGKSTCAFRFQTRDEVAIS
jgi:hypothetical protein